MTTPDEQMNGFIEALLVSNSARAIEFEVIMAQMKALIAAHQQLQTVIVSLVEQLGFLGALHTPDLRGHDQLS